VREDPERRPLMAATLKTCSFTVILAGIDDATEDAAESL
jgi:hypothetical protein